MKRVSAQRTEPWRRAARIAALVSAILAPAAEGRAQAGNSDAAAPAEGAIVIPLKPYVGRLRAMDVEVGGDTLLFLFDTGGGETLLTPEVARSLGCAPEGRSVSFRLSGERVQFAYCPHVELRIEGVAFHHREIAVWDLMAILPPGLPRLGGVISLKTFDGMVLSLALHDNQIRIENREALQRLVSDMQPLRVRIATGMDGSALVPFVAVSTAAMDLWFELDSGNLDHVLLSPHAASLLGVVRPDSVSAGERWEAEGVIVEVSRLDPVAVDVAVGDIIYDGVLSAKFLEEWIFVLDLGQRLMWGKAR